MINIFLPFIPENVKLYNQLLELSKKEKDYFFNNKIRFLGTYGNYSWSYWGSEKNTNFTSKVILRNEVRNIQNASNLPNILDLSNINLEEKDLYDRKLNMILEEYHNGTNKISFSNFNIFNIIKKQYPEYKFVLSEKICLTQIPTIETLNIISEQEEIDSILLDLNYFNNDFDITQLKRKNKFKIKLGSYCNSHCPNYINCQLNEQNLIYNFSSNTNFDKCVLINDEKNKILKIKEDILYYSKLGFNNFIIEKPLKRIPLEKFNLLLLMTFKNENNNKLLENIL